jgi:uracil-DNA glycosylase
MFVYSGSTAEERQSGRIMDGTIGKIFWPAFREMGLDRNECSFHPILPFELNQYSQITGPKATAIPDFRPLPVKGRGDNKYVQAKYQEYLDKLYARIEAVKPNLIVTLGVFPLWALAKKVSVDKYRGSPIKSNPHGWKILPTYDPLTIMRMWKNRPVFLSDLAKTAELSGSPEFTRPQRFIHIAPETVSELHQFYEEHLKDTEYVSCDVETKQKQITELGFANADGTQAVVIPIWDRAAKDGNYWVTLAEELKVWEFVRFVLAEKPTIGHNFNYDMMYIWGQYRIPIPKFLDDTMILHHSMQPEMKKSLGFLSSVYTLEPSWKFLRRSADTLKKED